MAQTRKEREQDWKMAGQSVLILAICLGAYVWHISHSFKVGLATFFASAFLLELLLLALAHQRRARLGSSSMQQIDAMNGDEFEAYLHAFFCQRGYRASLTPNGADFGADLILEQDGERTVVQAKHWKKTVGVKAVQEIVAAKSHYRATKSMVVCISSFSQNAILLARSNHVDLWDRSVLSREIQRFSVGAAPGKATTMVTTLQPIAATYPMASTHPATATYPTAAPQPVPIPQPMPIPQPAMISTAVTPSCPRCSSPMVLRHNRKDNTQFWGCSQFPHCRGTQPLAR